MIVIAIVVTATAVTAIVIAIVMIRMPKRRRRKRKRNGGTIATPTVTTAVVTTAGGETEGVVPPDTVGHHDGGTMIDPLRQYRRLPRHGALGIRDITILMGLDQAITDQGILPTCLPKCHLIR